MAQVAEYAIFGCLMALNMGLGLYFSLRRKARTAHTTAEVFLGSRALRAIPLGASVVASLVSSAGLVGFTGHFYAYGFHLNWHALTSLAVVPFVCHLFLPVLYGLRITSLFEYVRLRFNSAISLTACVSYIFLTQSMGAFAIFAASLTLYTIFGLPLMWCNIVIGLCGTLYTALGGLRGVVWTDCMQLVFILLGPATVIIKVIVDSSGSGSQTHSLLGLDWGAYIGNFKFDLRYDENVWAAFIGSAAAATYRAGLDQVVVQRCMASPTLRTAQRTVLVGCSFLVAVYAINMAMTLALVAWFRGCDPKLAGIIRSHDQILPYYVKKYLPHFIGFTGLFLASIVSAATSTISSLINSQTAVIYVDVLSQRYKNLDSHVRWITRGLAFLLGSIMTLYSCACYYMGSVTRVIIMVQSASTGPFVGLMLLAVIFPFVHSKGAGFSTLIMLAVQLVLMWHNMTHASRPPLMPLTLDHCPDNSTYLQTPRNISALSFGTMVPNSPPAFQLSPLWSCLFSSCATVLLGLLISFATGEHRLPTANISHLNRWCVRQWRKYGIIKQDEKLQEEAVLDHSAHTTSLLCEQNGVQEKTLV
ncbi:sodium-coupled monocarboxylate transporter 2-like [Haemaphysalis longicornis]